MDLVLGGFNACPIALSIHSYRGALMVANVDIRHFIEGLKIKWEPRDSGVHV